mmetsp:Transcript_3485/g.3305  ORF Transcript_3485/g.3305 Transcript_3485/m.3305 type:complete len:253 (-) Transcript_3485:137-895(-)|eukprot:CAMPEP_0197834750 /NCGR_PEP_ID=MMETSP1437-20131217/23551_1 /TAXON_ID=49252 ORGANISM="Eucampia antarctica, Strain CCMP1452" /NCGR_SAMPLE_ID=MMETSP1437 /ASSEMBLY_ACC=CAM_ASM_001096 /LENGTH=252 /DNA_ID=CAMNT_0043439681 /DNA_START=63 /DNA_END=821 /DNA_ORIENTATION=+
MDIKNDDLVVKATPWDKYDYDPKSNYAITGTESQVLTIGVSYGEMVRSEPGTMMYLTHGVKSGVSCDGSYGRFCSGEACCEITYTNESGMRGYAAITPNCPTANKVVPIDLSSPEVNGEILCQKGAYMASSGDVEVQVSFDCNFMRCCFGSMGWSKQKIVGSGTVFLCASGTIVQKVLAPGEKILVDTNCILAYASSCELDVQKASRKFLTGVIGGEGIYNTSLTGPGLVLIQSTNEENFLKALRSMPMLRR